MEFLLLDEIKVDQEFSYHTEVMPIKIESSQMKDLKAIDEYFFNYFDNMNITKIETYYQIVLDVAEEIDDEEAFFSRIVNIILAKFVNAICIPEGRKRERRLDVPEKLQDKVMISRSLLKKMINQKTHNERLNIQITWEGKQDSYCYDMINTKHPGEVIHE